MDHWKTIVFVIVLGILFNGFIFSLCKSFSDAQKDLYR